GPAPVEPAANPLRATIAAPASRVVNISSGPLEVRLAESAADIDAAQALRYRIFYEKMGARPLPGMESERRDRDQFDQICDHLLVLDHSRGAGLDAVVGTYRLIRRDAAARLGAFYSAAEYDIGPLIAYPGEILELGRSCVDASYRARPVMQLLWSGIAAYVFHYDIALMFGCASLPGTDPAALSVPLSYLYYHHLAPPALRARALPQRFIDMRRLALAAGLPLVAVAGLDRAAGAGAIGRAGDAPLVDRGIPVFLSSLVLPHPRLAGAPDRPAGRHPAGIVCRQPRLLSRHHRIGIVA